MTDTTNPITASFSVEMDGETATVTDTSTAAPGTVIDAVSFQFGSGQGPAVACAPGGSLSHTYANASQEMVTQTVTGNSSVTVTTKRPVYPKLVAAPPSALTPPPPPASPPPPPPITPPPVSILPSVHAPGITADSVTLTETFADGTAITVTAARGQRVPLVAGNRSGGSLKFYADGLCAKIENRYAGTTQDLTGTFHLVAGDTVLFDGPLTIGAGCSCRPFWLSAPVVNPNADLSMFPNIGSAPTASKYKAYLAADNSLMGRGYDEIAIGNTGESARLGPVPEGDADCLTNPSAENAVVVRGMADASSVWPYGAIDFDTGEMLDVTKYPGASFLPVCFGLNNPIFAWTTACPLNLNQAQGHDTNRNALAAVIFGTDYDKEELALWNNYVNALWQNPAYRLAEGVCSTSHGEIPRSIGRGLTSMLYAAKYSSNPAYFEAWIRPYLADLWTRLSAQTGIHIDQKGLVYENNGFAPWQNHILIYGLGLAVQFGYTEAQPILDYLAVTLLDSILTAQHEFATLYSVTGMDASGTVVADWKTALACTAVVNPKLSAAMPCAENSLELRQALAEPDAMTPGDFCGHPANPAGYCAMMRPAVVMVAQYGTDQTRAQAALAVLTAHDRADYSQNPKYDLVPRA